MVTLITGASGGLGRAVVQTFLASGATVFGADVAWKEKPAGLQTLEANLTEAADCERIAKQSAPDVLIHLVGGFDGGKPVAETSDDVWDRMMNMNLRTTLHMIRAVLPQMLARGHGRIVAIGSRAALEPMANFAAYSVSKAAVVTLVKSVALEVMDSGITVNTVLPSTIDTPANRAAMPNADFSKWVSPESIAKLLLWLSSDDAANVNGAAIPIYGRVK